MAADPRVPHSIHQQQHPFHTCGERATTLDSPRHTHATNSSDDANGSDTHATTRREHNHLEDAIHRTLVRTLSSSRGRDAPTGGLSAAAVTLGLLRAHSPAQTLFSDKPEVQRAARAWPPTPLKSPPESPPPSPLHRRGLSPRVDAAAHRSDRVAARTWRLHRALPNVNVREAIRRPEAELWHVRLLR